MTRPGTSIYCENKTYKLIRSLLGWRPLATVTLCSSYQVISSCQNTKYYATEEISRVREYKNAAKAVQTPTTNKCWLMSGAHKTQSLKLNLTCLTCLSSLAQQGIQNAEHHQEKMICCIHWKKLDLKAGSVKRTLCRPYTKHFRRTWTHRLGMMELEHFAWDFFLSLVLSDIALFHPAFTIVISCCLRTSFQPKRLDTTSLFPFNCHQEVLALLFIYLFIIINCLKKRNCSWLKVETFSNVQPSAQDLPTFEIDHAGRHGRWKWTFAEIFDKERKTVQIFYSDNFFMQNIFYLGSQYWTKFGLICLNVKFAIRNFAEIVRGTKTRCSSNIRANFK